VGVRRKPADDVCDVPNGGRRTVGSAAGSGIQGAFPQTIRVTDQQAGPRRERGRAIGVAMVDREKVVTVLRKRFPGAPVEEVAAAANAIVGLTDEWEDVPLGEPEVIALLSRHLGLNEDDSDVVTQFRLLRHRPR
jgi:hypothetical protein